MYFEYIVCSSQGSRNRTWFQDQARDQNRYLGLAVHINVSILGHEHSGKFDGFKWKLPKIVEKQSLSYDLVFRQLLQLILISV